MRNLTAVLLLASCAAPTHELRTGDEAPGFTLPDTRGRPVSLDSLVAGGPVILAFFPKAFTGG